MKTQVNGKTALSDVLAAVLLGLLLLLIVLVHRTPGFQPYPPSVNPFFLMQPEEIREESISGYAGVSRTYTFTVQHDEAVRRGASLYVWLRHTNAVVWLDGDRHTPYRAYAGQLLAHRPAARGGYRKGPDGSAYAGL